VLACPQTEESLEDMLVSALTVESLVCVLVSPLPEKLRRMCLLQMEESVEDVLVSAQTETLLETVFVETLPGNLRRVLAEKQPSERVLLSPLKLSLKDFAI